MSYFACGFKATGVACTTLQDLVADVVPRDLRADPLTVSESPHLVTYGHRKVIQHLVVHDRGLKSWLAIIGTPLVRTYSERDKHALLADFLTSPVRPLRDRIDGNFAIIAYDGRRDRLIAATDLNNTTPVFYAVTSSGIFLSSHELPLARLLTPKIDVFGFSQAVQLGVTWGSRTRFNDIQKLLAGYILTCEGAGPLRAERYWAPHDETLWRGTLDENIERWGSLLRESVWAFYERSGGGSVLCDFTGGEDSRLILAHCHALRIPYKAHVKGFDNDIDVVVAAEAAKRVGFELIQRRRHYISPDEFAEAPSICLRSDAYLQYLDACSDYATDRAEPLDDYAVIKYCGMPGGEAFRGSYYLRGKALFPSRQQALDYRFFTRLKYLLDYHPGLTTYEDDDFLDGIHDIVRQNLDDVAAYPIGTQIDHLLRVFQTCSNGLMYKDPLYLPLATNPLTRSIYWLSPRWKRGGRLTRACTEILFPELASVPTQTGVPTIRRTLRRQPLFFKEYGATLRKISAGAMSRLWKWTETGGTSFRTELFAALLNSRPLCDWLSSPNAMMTGQYYQPDVLGTLLAHARAGSWKYIPTLARVIGHECAMRWVYSRHGVVSRERLTLRQAREGISRS